MKLKKIRLIGLGVFKSLSVLNRTQETEGLLGYNFYNFLLFRSKTIDPRKDMIVIKWHWTSYLIWCVGYHMGKYSNSITTLQCNNKLITMFRDLRLMFLSFVEHNVVFYYQKLSVWISSKLAIKVTERVLFTENSKLTILRMASMTSDLLRVGLRMHLEKKKINHKKL